MNKVPSALIYHVRVYEAWNGACVEKGGESSSGATIETKVSVYFVVSVDHNENDAGFTGQFYTSPGPS